MNDDLFERARGDLVVSTDRARIDVDLVHRLLGRTYWAQGIPREILVRSIDNSVAFGLYQGAGQLGFARVITDLASYGYLADVIVADERRGEGLGKFLVESIMLHPQLQGFRRFALFTRDAETLYERYGFRVPDSLTGYMQIHRPDAYRARSAD